MWFLIALIGYFLLAVVIILDKFILTKSVSKPIIYTFYSTIFMFGALLAWPLGVEFLVGVDWLIAIVSGLSFGLAMWALFIAIKKGETTHISPFNGAIITMATYGLSSYFLGESLTQLQLTGMVILVFATFLLSFEKSRRNNGFHIGFVWAIISGILFALSHVSAKYIYSLYPFLTGFVWTRTFIGLVGLVALFYPSVRNSLKRKEKKQTKKHIVPLIVVDKVLAVLAVILIQYALAIGSVSLVIALSGLQFAFVFILVYLLTKLTPKLLKEYFTNREIAVQLIAITLVVLGSALFVI